MPKGSVPPHALFDFLLTNTGLKNDAAISQKADVCASTICKIRNSKIALSNDVRIAIMRAFGLSLAKVDELAPPVVKGEKK